MSPTEENALLAQLENAKANVRVSVRKSRSLIAAYRNRLGSLPTPANDRAAFARD